MKSLTVLLAFLLLFSFCAFAQAPQYDFLIRNGRVMDGSGNPWTSADIGIIGDHIAFIGHADEKVTAKRTIDPAGLVFAPGFIAMLIPSELNLLVHRHDATKLTPGLSTAIPVAG